MDTVERAVLEDPELGVQSAHTAQTKEIDIQGDNAPSVFSYNVSSQCLIMVDLLQNRLFPNSR